MADPEIAVVTGTASGIGLHTALGLAHKGRRVVATTRDTGRSAVLRAEASRQDVDLTVRAQDAVAVDVAVVSTLPSRDSLSLTSPGGEDTLRAVMDGLQQQWASSRGSARCGLRWGSRGSGSGCTRMYAATRTPSTYRSDPGQVLHWVFQFSWCGGILSGSP